MTMLKTLKRILIILTARNIDKAREAEIDEFGGGMVKPKEPEK